MSTAVDAVLFDLDDTLCRYRRSSATVLEASFARLGLDPLFEPRAYYARYGEYLEASSSVHDLRERCFADLAVEAGYDRETGVAVAEAFAAERDQRAVDPLPGVPDVLDRIAAYRPLGLVTNGDPTMQRQKLEALDLEGTFETSVYAGYETPPKPDPAPFEVALETLAVEPDRALYVGNSLSSDVAGAAAAGLRSVWIPTTDDPPADPDPTPDYVLETLVELEEITCLSGKARR